MEKKNFFAPSTKGLGATRRAAAMLLVMLLTTATAWAWSGSGTSENDPILITNAADLTQLATDVNGGERYNKMYFKQTANITLTSAWTPIGTDISHPFKGHYDGGGYTISGLTVSGNYQHAGLFGYISSDYYQGSQIPTELKNINIVDCNIDVSSGGQGNGKAGGIAGYVSCFNMSNCKVSGTIKGYGYAAGLIGQAGSFCKMNDSFADVTVSAHKADPNPENPAPAYYLIGQYSNNMSASDNYYHDNGGNVSANINSVIKNSATPLYTVSTTDGVTVAATNATLTYNAKHYFAAGSTASLTVDDANKILRTFSVSGGATYNVAANKKSATVTLGSSDATVTATLQTIGGTCGTNATWTVTDTDSDGTYETLTISGSGAITSSPWATDFAATITRVNISSADLTISDNPFSTLGGSAVIVVPTPAYALGYSSAAFASKLRVALRSYLFSVTNEGGTPAYAITGETDLRNLAAVINGNTNASTAITGQGVTFRQTANIAFSNQTFTPIGAQGTYYKWFEGTYDGGGYTISGLTVSTDKQHAGLFGRLISATIKNVVLVSPTVTSDYYIYYDFAEVGALAGRMDEGSKMENCLVINPTVSASNSKKRVGAIVGNLYYKTDRLTNTLFYSTTDYGLYGDRHVLSTITNSGRARKVTLGSGVSIESPAATSLEYGFVYEAETYYREGVTLTLTGVSPTGYFPIYSANGTALGGNTYSVNSTDGDVTITLSGNVPITYTVHFNGNGNTGGSMSNQDFTYDAAQNLTANGFTRTGYTFAGWATSPNGPVEYADNESVINLTATDGGTVNLYAKWGIPYIDADGNTQLCTNNVTVLTNETDVSDLAGGWYVVMEDVSYNSQFFCFSGDIHLILCDGAKMTVTETSDVAMCLSGGSLTIYAQSTGSSMGQLKATSSNYHGISTNCDVTINGGQVSATGGEYHSGIHGHRHVTINSGQVSATGGNAGIFAGQGNITLGLRNATDYIYANNFTIFFYDDGANIIVKAGQTLTDGTNTYSGSLGQTLSGRTFYLYTEHLDVAANAHDGNYWTTFYCGHTDYKIDEGENAWAYTAEYNGANSLTLHKLGKVIPKNTAVILVGADNSISMTASSEAAQYSVANNLHGTDIRTATSELGTGTFYVMGKQSGNFGFFPYTAQYMPARKAYLLVDGGAAQARGLTMTFDETTGISSTTNYTNDTNDNAWYTLDGRKLDGKPTTKGLYIHNGKKTVIK